jgi:hypothetical protein
MDEGVPAVAEQLLSHCRNVVLAAGGKGPGVQVGVRSVG